MGEWYYIGHYGQLGPLTREQIDELVSGGVITRDTYVWRNGMSDWQYAERCAELAGAFAMAAPFAAPPPKPMPLVNPTFSPEPPQTMYETDLRRAPSYPRMYMGLKSDRSRTAAGILQLILPGVGRMYLGYLAYGVIQLVLAIGTCGIFWIWSFIDGIVILSGGVQLDGYGRQLSD